MRSWLIPLVVYPLVGVALGAPSAAGEILLDGFESLEPWAPNEDGGNAPSIALDLTDVVEGAAAMRLAYTNESPNWGNLTRDVDIPNEVTAIGIDIRKHSSGPGAAMHLWLMEEDGDAWVAQLRPDGRSLGAVPEALYRVVVPVASFQFEPRGPGTRDMPSTSRMLLGCNFDDLEVTVDRLVLLTRDAAATDSLPCDPELVPEHGLKGCVLILGGDMPRTDGASDPARLAELLRGAGWGATVVQPGDLSRLLDPATADVLVVPGGPAFPAEAVDSLRRYLAGGGNLLTMGGYAFDEPLSYSGGDWLPVGSELMAAEVSAGGEDVQARVNSRIGVHGDTMGLDPEQLQVFDPSFPLKRVAGARSAPGQSVVAPEVRIARELHGYAAVSTLGSNSPVFPDLWGRRIPLLETYDAFGRPRGAAGALVHYFDGPYAGSNWAFFGVTNYDLFTGQDAPLAAAVPALMDALTAPTYLRRVAAEHACYHRGEDVTIEGEVWLDGDEIDAHVTISSPVLGAVRAEIGEPTAGTGLRAFSVTVAAPTLLSDYDEVRAELVVDGSIVDTMETAYVVWDTAVIEAGPTVAIEGSRLIIDGNPHVRLGTNQTGFMWYSEHEDPRVWDADFRAMRDHQIRILRVLHFSPYSEGGYAGQPSNRPEALQYRPERLCRQTDAMVQLAQKHGIVLFLTLHDWMQVGLTEEQYQAQADWNRFWTERYRDVPGIIYDIQNEPDIGDPPDYPNLVDLYNEMLADRYGDEDGLRSSWGVDELPGRWGQVPIQRGGSDWADVRAHDYWLFKMRVYNHWVQRNAEGILAGDPDALFTVGHLISNVHADKQLGAAHVPFTNTHYYGDLFSFGEYLKFSDRLVAGKPLTIGEFGAQEAHDERTRGGDATRDAASVQRFVWYGHTALGLDATFLCNWSWKDFEGAVFPWGMRYLQDPVSKDVLLAQRAQGLALLGIELPPVRSRQLYVVTPDCHRFGPMFGEIESALRRVFATLYGLGVPFGLLTEADLATIPEAAEALIWPVPYCADETTLDRLEEWVTAGGSLYLSGTIAYDDCRRLTADGRAGRFGIEQFPKARPGQAGEATEATSVALGEGLVHFVPTPVELSAREALSDLYRSFLVDAGIPHTPAEQPLQALKPTADGLTVLLNPQNEPTLAVYGGIEAEMPAGAAVMVHAAANGRPKVVHGYGSLARAGRLVFASAGELFLMGLSDDALNDGPGALLCALTPGPLRLPALDRAEVLVAEVGDLVDGRWTGYETRTLNRTSGGPGLDVPEEWALSLVLVYPTGAREAAVEAVEALARR